MRRFEFSGGTSEKFWEVDQAGADVTVRFGRLGTNGQTQTKILDSEADATAHVAKLVAEKLKKGYKETAAIGAALAPAKAAAEPAPTPAAAPVAAPTAEVQEPVAPTAGEAGTSVASDSGFDPSTLPDEDTFTVPATWARQAGPFRGLRPAKPITFDQAAAMAKADGYRTASVGGVRNILDHPSSNPELVQRAAAYLGWSGGSGRAEQAADPVGAAVVLLAQRNSIPWQHVDGYDVMVDDLVARHGLPFAAVAVAALGHLALTNGLQYLPQHGAPANTWVVTADKAVPNFFTNRQLLARMRAHLAGTDDATYAQAVAAVEPFRSGPPSASAAAACLFPSEREWVQAALDAYPTSSGWYGLLSSCTTAEQVDVILRRTPSYEIVNRPELVWGIGANLGTDAAGPLAKLLEAGDADNVKRVLGMLSVIPTDAALGLLVDRIDQKYVSPVVIEALSRFPARSLRLLAARAGGSDAKARQCRELLRGHLISHPGLAQHLEADLPEQSRAVIAGLVDDTVRVPEASPEQVPVVLREPPWTRTTKRSKPVVVAGLASASGLSLAWKPGEREEWAAEPIGGLGSMLPQDWGQAVAEVLDPTSRWRYRALTILAGAPPEVSGPRLSTFTPTTLWDGLAPLQKLLAKVGDGAMVFTVRVVASQPMSLAPALLPLEGSEVATLMADWLARSKSLRPLTITWLGRHPESAARDLIPGALAKPGKARTAAERALRVLAQQGHRDVALAAAEHHGPEASSAIEAMLDADPLDQLPPKMPPLPAWLEPAHLPQVLLPGRDVALPVDAVRAICQMLQICKPGETYAGIELVKQETDPASLAEGAWGIFERWRSAGYPSKDSWVLEALALVGDDETVRRLSPIIRAWPGEGGHSRAVAGLDVLSGIGSDVALMHLHAISEKAKFKGLKTKARERMAEVAEELGLTPEQLADRLVPDFGLDPDGTMVLDYGPRRFVVGFDEQLKPTVADEGGSARKALPKPGANDDATLAPQAYATFSGLKKDVKTIAVDQIRRFEQAMVTGRRWPAQELKALFIDHPLLWHLSRRLVWGTFTDEGLSGSFRVAEDRTLADVEDEELHLDDATVVGIAHPLVLGSDLGRWSDLLADYEILQPFEQLGRDTYALTDAERSATKLTRLDGHTIETGRVLGLSHRGWERGTPQDAGIIPIVQKPVRGTQRYVVIDLDPGIIAGAAMEWKEQQVREVWISDGPADWSASGSTHTFAELDAVTASELIRDLEHLKG